MQMLRTPVITQFAGMAEFHFDVPDPVSTVGTSGADTLNGTTGDDRLKGLGGDDVLDGGQGADSLIGGAGNDYLKGGEGSDLLDGGDGFDRVGFFDFGGSVGAHASLLLQGVAQDTGHGMDTLVGIEHLSGTLFDDVLIGDGAGNWLWGVIGGVDSLVGNGGDDLLEVSVQGAHTLNGGAGNDAILIDGTGTQPINDITIDLNIQGAAQDTGNGLMLLKGIESVSGSGSDFTSDHLTGDGAANTLAGAEAADVLVGNRGTDLLLGDGYIYLADNGAHTSGPITVFQSGAGEGADTLDGGAGDDILVGGDGADSLTGGKGADTFAFLTAGESAVGASDLILDLTRSDTIDLSAIDADSAVDGDQAFVLVARLDGHAGEAALHFDKEVGLTELLLDIDGDGDADAEIDLVGKFKTFDNLVL